MVKAVIFDMDGLMFDSESMWLSTWKPAFEKHGIELKPEIIEKAPGSSRRLMTQLAIRLYGNKPEVLEAVNDHYALAHDLFLSKPVPKKEGLDELLEYLKMNHIPCAVASSSAREIVDANLMHAGIEDRFMAIVTGDEDLPSKPAPDIFLEAASRLGSKPNESLVLEDSENGIRAAAAGGFKSIWVPDVIDISDEAKELASNTCESLLDVCDWLKKQMA